MKTLICIPSMDMCPIEFASSLARLNKEGEVALQITKGSLIYESRNKLGLAAIKASADYALWLDSDMVFPANALEKMIRHMENGYDIVTGVYYRRCGSYAPVIFKNVEFDANGRCQFENYDDFPKDKMFQIGAAGFGCIMMKTDVLIDVFSKFGTAFTPIGNTGEDIAFCWRARQLGRKIYADPSIKLGHVGYQVITGEFFDAYRNEAEQHGNDNPTG